MSDEEVKMVKIKQDIPVPCWFIQNNLVKEIITDNIIDVGCGDVKINHGEYSDSIGIITVCVEEDDLDVARLNLRNVRRDLIGKYVAYQAKLQKCVEHMYESIKDE